MTLCIFDRGVLKSSTTTVLECTCDFKSISMCFMKLAVPTLGAYKLIIVIFSLYIASFVSMK
jgi:hypothetical protein